MRLAGIEKLGFYPTPPKSLNEIVKMVQLSRYDSARQTYRIIDPTAGEGEALFALQNKLENEIKGYDLKQKTVESYAIELSPDRAAKAEQALDHVLQCPYQQANVSDDKFHVLWLNPMYDESGDKATKRMEYVALKDMYSCLIPGGILIYIVPRSMLAHDRASRLLQAQFENMEIRRFPDGEYEAYKQVVIIAKRRVAPMQVDPTVNYFAYYEKAGIKVLGEYERYSPSFFMPTPVRLEAPTFEKRRYTNEEISSLVCQGGVHTSKEWADHWRTNQEVTFQPIMTMKLAHIAGLISSGSMGTLILKEGVAKGTSRKVQTTLDKNGSIVEPNSPDRNRIVEKFQTQVFYLGKDGNLAIIEDGEKLEAFIKANIVELSDQVEKKYKPLYTGPTPAEWKAVSLLALSKQLPGVENPGLLDAQKHVVIASSRALRKNGYIDIVGEMGTGKTLLAPSITVLMIRTALYSAETVNAQASVIICPGHLVKKWKREIEAVVPNSKAYIVESISDLQVISQAKGKHPIYAILSKEKAKLGAGWQPAFSKKVLKDNRGKPTKFRILACPQCGSAVKNDEGGAIYVQSGLTKEGTYMKRPNKCDQCKSPLYEMSEAGHIPADHQFGYEEKSVETTLRKGLRRQALATYISKKMKGFFDVLIADEFHHYAGKATAQSIAYHRLHKATKYTINLTGTIFGGKASSIFWLLMRNMHEVSSAYSYNDEARWVETFGRLEKTLKQDESSGNYHRFNAKKATVTSVRELNGVSTAVYQYVLPSCIFLRIQDLGIPMPEYEEQIVKINMSAELAAQYEDIDKELMEKIKACRSSDKEVSKALVPVWFQTVLGRPNSCFRTEQIIWKNPETGQHEDYGKEMLPVSSRPKEDWLINIKEELKQDRKCVLFVRQTGTRDIQPHLQSILKGMGINAQILPTNLKPINREEWIEKNKPDVLIVNPRKVETGLDLIMYATGIFYEVEYSLYTLWQAMRRLWRPGQTKKVKMIFLAYNGTMEAAAIKIMGKKLKASAALYGDDASAVFAEEDDEDLDVMATATKQAMLDQRVADDMSLDGVAALVQQFARSNNVIKHRDLTPKPPPVIERQVTKINKDDWINKIQYGRKGKEKVQLPQMSFFDLAEAA